MKKYLWTLTGLLVVVALGSLYKVYVIDTHKEAARIIDDYRNGTYRIGGQDIAFVDGVSILQGVMGASDITTTRIFGNEVKGDLDGDGQDDIAFLVTQNNGGSGIFYMAVVALSSDRGIHTTQPYLLGDRIAPQSTEYRDGVVVFNYATRRDDEPFTARASIGVSAALKVIGGKLIQAE